MLKIWGIGDITKEDIGDQNFTHIEAPEGNDVNNHVTLQRAFHNIYENERSLYEFIKYLTQFTKADKGVFRSNQDEFLVEGVSVELDGTMKHYAVVHPGIAFVDDYVVMVSPQLYIAERQLESIFGLAVWLREDEREKVTIQYDGSTYHAHIKKYDEHGELQEYEFSANTGVQLLEKIYNDNDDYGNITGSLFGPVLNSVIGKNLDKITLEKSFEVSNGSYYLGISNEGEIYNENSSGYFDMYEYTVNVTSTPIISSIENVKQYFLHHNDFKHNIFLNVPETIDTSSITDPVNDSSIDYSLINNNNQYITVLRKDGSSNDNAIIYWDESTKQFHINKNIRVYHNESSPSEYKTFNSLVADASSAVDTVEDLDELNSISDPPDSAIRFVRSTNCFFRYRLSVDGWIHVSDPYKQYKQSTEIITATSSQTVFEPSLDFKIDGSNLQIFVDGLKQEMGPTYDYQITDVNTVTFNSGLSAGQIVSFCIIDGGQNFYPSEQHFDATSGQTEFEIDFPVREEKQVVYVNGILQREGISHDFTVNEDDNKVIFNSGLSSGDHVLVKDSFTIAGNWELLNKGTVFPEEPVFGLTFYYEEEDNWYKFNGSIWIQQ